MITINVNEWTKIGSGSMVVKADSITEYILFADSNFNIFDSGYCNPKSIVGFGDVYAKSTVNTIGLSVSSLNCSNAKGTSTVLDLPIAVPTKPNCLLVSYMENGIVKTKWLNYDEYSDWVMEAQRFKFLENAIADFGGVRLKGGKFRGEYIKPINELTLLYSEQPITFNLVDDSGVVYTLNTHFESENRLSIQHIYMKGDSGTNLTAVFDLPYSYGALKVTEQGLGLYADEFFIGTVIPNNSLRFIGFNGEAVSPDTLINV